jgi:hypothetical protein
MQWYQHILGVNVQNFMQLDGRADFLRPSTWSRVPSDKGTASNFVGKKYVGDPGNDQTSVRGRKHKQYTEVQTH